MQKAKTKWQTIAEQAPNETRTLAPGTEVEVVDSTGPFWSCRLDGESGLWAIPGNDLELI